MKRIVLGALGSALVALPIALADAAPRPEAVGPGVDYIRTTQQPDGGFGGFGAGQTMDAIYAIRAAGVDPNTVTTEDGLSPADYLEVVAAEQETAPAAAKAALATVALDLDPTDVAGTDFHAVITSAYDDETGQYDPTSFSQALVMLGLQCTGATVPSAAVDALEAMQLADGGWGFADTGDPDNTAIVIQALVEAGVSADEESVANGLAFLANVQGADGGWGFDPFESNANSTAYVLQALIAAGEDPEGEAWTVDGVNPVDFLVGLQAEDGSFPGFDPAYATNQAVPALAGRTFCNAVTTEIVVEQTPTPASTQISTTTPAPPSPTATPESATATPTIAAPRPPATGNGSGGGSLSPVIGGSAIGLAIAVFGVAVFAARRRTA